MNQKAQAKRQFPYVTLILLVSLALVVLILGYSFVESIGLIGRFNNEARSDNFKLNKNHINVYYSHEFQNAYQNYYYQYLMASYGQGTNTSFIKQFSSPEEYISYMISYNAPVLQGNAYNAAEMYLTYCEGALADGVYDKLKEEIKPELDEYMESIKAGAKEQGVTIFTYLKNNVGVGVSQNDVKKAMEILFIGLKYAENKQTEYSDGVTLEEMEKYRDDNKSAFYTATYTSYQLSSNDMKAAIEKCKTADEVKNVIIDHYLNQLFDEQYKSKITNAKVEDTAGKDKTKADVKTTLLATHKLGDAKAVFTSTDTDAYKKAAYQITNTINNALKSQITAVKEGTAGWADPKGSGATDLQKWLFGDGRKAGDFTILTTEKSTTTDGKVNKTTVYTWYVVDKATALDTELTKDAYFVTLTDDKADTEGALTAAQKAEAFYNALKDDKTPEKFAELAAKYAAGANSALQENISFEIMKGSNEDLANWLYEEGRAKGDIVNIPVKNDPDDKEKVTGHIIAMFEEENEETWKLEARAGVAADKLQVWYEDAVVKYNVTIDYEPETAPETTAPETTAAATSKLEDPEDPTEAATEGATEEPTDGATEAPTNAE